MSHIYYIWVTYSNEIAFTYRQICLDVIVKFWKRYAYYINSINNIIMFLIDKTWQYQLHVTLNKAYDLYSLFRGHAPLNVMLAAKSGYT